MTVFIETRHGKTFFVAGATDKEQILLMCQNSKVYFIAVGHRIYLLCAKTLVVH